MQGCVNKIIEQIKTPSCRFLCSLGFFYCTFIVVLAYILEHVYELEPCPLCLLQRIVIAVIGMLLLVWAGLNPRPIYSYFLAGLLFIINGSGIFLAARQVWLQNLPKELVPSCSAGIYRLMEVYPILKVLEMVIRGTGECAKIDFTLFGLSIAMLSLINFILLAMFILFLIYWQKKRWTR